MLTFLQVATINFQDTATNDLLAGSETNLAEWFSRILGAILVIGVLLVLIYLLWGAISWISSGGDTAKVQKARDQMTQAVIGLIVLTAVTAIYMLVQQALGIEVINFVSPKTVDKAAIQRSIKDIN